MRLSKKYNPACNLQLATCNSQIALLGGSFNPAHRGHLHISQEAMKRLGIRQVWWLVSPKNPLKSAHTLADYAERLEGARAVAAADARIRVTDIEAALGTHYTIHTLRALQKRCPRTQFVWLMGADNLAQFHRWKAWQEIARLVPVVVCDRAPYSHAALRAKAAIAWGKNRVTRCNKNTISTLRAPAFCFLHLPRDATSATKIRKSLENGRK